MTWNCIHAWLTAFQVFNTLLNASDYSFRYVSRTSDTELLSVQWQSDVDKYSESCFESMAGMESLKTIFDHLNSFICLTDLRDPEKRWPIWSGLCKLTWPSCNSDYLTCLFASGVLVYGLGYMCIHSTLRWNNK